MNQQSQTSTTNSVGTITQPSTSTQTSQTPRSEVENTSAQTSMINQSSAASQTVLEAAPTDSPAGDVPPPTPSTNNDPN